MDPSSARTETGKDGNKIPREKMMQKFNPIKEREKPIRCSFGRCVLGIHGKWGSCPYRAGTWCYKDFTKHKAVI